MGGAVAVVVVVVVAPVRHVGGHVQVLGERYESRDFLVQSLAVLKPLKKGCVQHHLATGFIIILV